jgi:hypothetical protein
VTCNEVWVIVVRPPRLGAPANRYALPSTRAMPQSAAVRPFQKVDHDPARLSDACQVLRYIERTASGVAGGRAG